MSRLYRKEGKIKKKGGQKEEGKYNLGISLEEFERRIRSRKNDTEREQIRAQSVISKWRSNVRKKREDGEGYMNETKYKKVEYQFTPKPHSSGAVKSSVKEGFPNLMIKIRD